MADIFYFSGEDREASEDRRMFQIPLRDCIHLFDLRPWQRECGTDVFPELLTGNPLVDAGGYIHVLLRIDEEEIKQTGERGYEPGWYKMNMTVIEVQSVVAEAAKKQASAAPPPEKK